MRSDTLLFRLRHSIYGLANKIWGNERERENESPGNEAAMLLNLNILYCSFTATPYTTGAAYLGSSSAPGRASPNSVDNAMPSRASNGANSVRR